MSRARRASLSLLGLVFAGSSSACAAAAPPAPSSPPAAVASTPRGQPIEFEFPSVGEDALVSSATTRGRATALLFITTYDLASQLLVRQLGEVLTSFTPRANAAAVVMEPPQYAELLPAYREAMSLPYPVVMADFATQRGAGPFGDITRVPTLIVLDREGRLVLRHEGPLEPADLRAALRRGSARGAPADGR